MIMISSLQMRELRFKQLAQGYIAQNWGSLLLMPEPGGGAPYSASTQQANTDVGLIDGTLPGASGHWISVSQGFLLSFGVTQLSHHVN